MQTPFCIFMEHTWELELCEDTTTTMKAALLMKQPKLLQAHQPLSLNLLLRLKPGHQYQSNRTLPSNRITNADCF